MRYPTAYDFLIRSRDIKNLKITTNTGLSIKPQQEITTEGTKIVFAFPAAIVGKNKAQTYKVNYLNSDFVMGSGNSTELVIPPLGIADNHASMSATVMVAASNCPNIYTDPLPEEQTSTNGIITYAYGSLTNTSSLFVRCTDKRFITMNLNYSLENTNMTPIETQITLPPDTQYQQFEFTNIEPKPISLSTDNDGNPIATYKLEPKEQQQISVSAKGILSVVSNAVSWPAEMNHSYLSSQPYWPTNDSRIKKKTESMNQPNQILQYLSESTSYDNAPTNQTTRHGAKQLDSDPTHFTGQDYVDAFVTLMRGSGIMSRRLVGYTGSSSSIRPHTVIADKLHAWADYYDAQTNSWIQVDPTWKAITHSNLFSPIQDMHHIVLAINGSSDSTPYPAGFYSTTTNPTPVISVTDNDPFTLNLPTIHANLNQTLLTPPVLIIKNKGMTALYQQPITIRDGDKYQNQTINRLPIGGQVIIPLNHHNKHDQITVLIQDQTITVNESPFSFKGYVAVASIVVAIAGLLAAITRRLLVSRRRR